MGMLTAIFSLTGGLALLVAGGEGTVRGSVSTAARLKMPPYIIGATVVAFGTSAPELVVTLTAGLQGSPGIALGNIVGSNIANLGLILGVAALIRPLALGRRSLLFELPVVMLVAGLMVLVGWNGNVSRGEGLLLLAGTVFVIYRTIKGARTGRHSLGETTQKLYGLPLSFVILAAGIALLILGGQLLVSGAVSISRAFGVPEYVIGVVAVAVGTSLPEAAASISSAVHGRGDLAIGNILGSNAFNVLFVLGTGATIRPIGVEHSIVPGLMVYAFLTVLPIAILLKNNRLSRWGGVALFVVYVSYIVFVLVH